MKPHERGWLREYLDSRREMLSELTGSEGRKGSHPEQSLYRVVQPTGLMYGLSIGPAGMDSAGALTEKDRMKILLAESLVSSSLLYQEKPVTNVDDFYAVIMRTLENIAGFYNNVFPELATPTRSIFGKRKSALELAERVIEKRIEHTNFNDSNFWVHFFHNSLLFLDVFIYGQWMHTNADRIVADFFRYEREELRFSLVKVIAAAAHADRHIEFEERKLFDFFLLGADLPGDKKKEAQKIFEEGIEIEEISLPSENSWILKKFFLEIAILTTWADRRLEESEEDFIHRFSQYLGFSGEDLENSFMAIEGFILEHWEQLASLQDKQDYAAVRDRFVNRVQRLCEKDKNRIVREIRSSEDVMKLILKARTSELNEGDKETVREQLLTVLRTIPTFVIVSLPQHFLTLPLLMKVLPRDIFAEV